MPLQDNVIAMDVYGNSRTGDCSFYPGGSEDAPRYSSVQLTDPSAFQSLRTASGTSAQTLKSHWQNATVTHDGQSVSMYGWNATEYRIVNADANGYAGSMVQFHMAPIFDPSGADQYFERLLAPIRNRTSFDRVGLTLNSAHTNMVALWYRFENAATGEPVELDEFSISFFDFDQDWADGDKAYIRESVMMAEWTTMFVSNATELEIVNTEVPVRTATSLDPSTREPTGWGLETKPGAIVRSTVHGSGQAFAVKGEWEHCQGSCLQTPVCSMPQLLSAHSPSSTMYWSGCGFSDAGFGTPANAGASYFTASGNPIACTLDCPRTATSYDDGNPSDPFALTAQQMNRAVTFLFRKRSNITVFVKLEVGSTALANTNNDLYDAAGNGPDINRVARFRAQLPLRWRQRAERWLSDAFPVFTSDVSTKSTSARATPSCTTAHAYGAPSTATTTRPTTRPTTGTPTTVTPITGTPTTVTPTTTSATTSSTNGPFTSSTIPRRTAAAFATFSFATIRATAPISSLTSDALATCASSTIRTHTGTDVTYTDVAYTICPLIACSTIAIAVPTAA